jgi:RNA polymerase sigma-70 factor (ECF subfamily)
MRILDESDWVECYRAWEKPLYSIVYRIVWDASESQDIVQDAFLRCWRKREGIRVDGFKALIFKTALNLARSRRRRDKIWRFIGLQSAELDLGEHWNDNEHLPTAVYEAIEKLPGNLKNALLLTELAGMTYAEIGEILGIKEGTVGSRRTRAIEMVRRQLNI